MKINRFKRYILLFCVVLLLSLLNSFAYADNKGIESDISWYQDQYSEYVISTPEALLGFCELLEAENTFEGKVVKLGADIDLNNFDWICTKSFSGTFNGDNHKIQNISLTNGFFSILRKANIENLTIENASLKASSGWYGLVANRAIGSTIVNCIVQGKLEVTGSGSACGGLVGSLEFSDINEIKVYNTIINGDNSTGGIIGIARTPFEKVDKQGNVISSCSFSGSINGNNGMVGGIVGSTSFGSNVLSSIDNCIVEKDSNLITSGDYNGGIIGQSFECNALVTNCLNYASIEGNSYVGGLAGTTDLYFAKCSNYGTIKGKDCVGGLVGAMGIENISNCSNYGIVEAVSDNCASLGTVDKWSEVNIRNTFVLPLSTKAQISNSTDFNASYQNVYYNSDSEVPAIPNAETLPEGILSYTATDLVDRTLVDKLNAGQDETVWAQGIDYPVLASTIVVPESMEAIAAKTELQSGETTELSVVFAPEETVNKKVSYATSDESVATVDENGVVTGVTAGTVEISVKAYGAADLLQTITITVKNAQSLELKDSTAVYTGNAIEVESATGMAGTGKVTYTYYSDAECTQVIESAVNPGTYYVIAEIEADDSYYAATSNVAKLVVKKASSKITITDKTTNYTGKTISIAKAKVTGTSGKVTYTYYSDKACTKKVTAHKNAGTYYVKATAASDTCYNSATSKAAKLVIKPVAAKLTVKVSSKTYTVKSLAKANKNFYIGAAVNSKGKLTYKSSSKKVTVSTKGKVTVKKGTKKGTYTVTVTAAAKGNYLKATKKVTIKVK